MANTVKIKTGLAANLPAALQKGEQAFTTDTKKFYVGDGAANTCVNPDKAPSAAVADKLSTARAISLTGDVTGTANFDGTANAPIAATLANSGVAAGTHTKVTVDAKGRVTAGASLAAADIPNITLSKIADAGTAAGKNVGTASGQVPLLNAKGKLEDSVIPGLAIVDVVIAASEAAMLAQTGLDPGDMCVRTDTGDLFVLKQAPASALANWVPIYAKTGVLAVNGQTGPDVNVTTITGNAGSATKLQTARTLALTGDVAASGTFDGSANYSAAAALSATGVTAGTYKSVTVDAKGRVSAGTNPTTLAGYGITDAVASTGTAASATKLATARTVQTNLASTAAASFDGTANIAPGVTGVLPVANGGTGAGALTGIAKGNGAGAFTAAVIDADYIGPNSVIDCGTF